MKTYLTYTALIEAITGLALLIAPTTLTRILFETELKDPLSSLLAFIAGTAILSLAFAVWMTRSATAPGIILKMLLFYNALISLVFFYSILKLGFGGIGLWIVILFHLIQSVIAVRLLFKRS